MNVCSTRSVFYLRRRAATPAAPLLCLSLLTVLAVAIGYVSKVAQRPARTPILLLGCHYNPRWDLNAWVNEDLERIQRLKTANFLPLSLGDTAKLGAGIWDETNDVLRASLAHCPPDRACLIYMNMHAAVNHQGRACLIPPAASPARDDSWLQLEHVIQNIEQCQPTSPRNIVMVMECGKLDSWLAAGIEANDFNTSLGQLVEATNERITGWNLVVIVSHSDGQRSRALPGRGPTRGNLFTSTVARGLAGAADGAGADGRKDLRLTVAELHAYTEQQVSSISKSIWGSPQTPTIHCTLSGEQCLLAELSESAVDLQLFPATPPSENVVAALDHDLVRLQNLMQHDAPRTHPIRWQALIRQSQAVTEAVYCGAITSSDQLRWRQVLEAQFNDLQTMHLAQAQSWANAPDQANLRSAITTWQLLLTNPTLENTNTILRIAPGEANSATSASDQSFDPRHVPELWVWSARPSLSIWRSPDVLTRLATTRHAWLQAQQPVSPQEWQLVEPHVQRVEISYRQLCDAILANGILPGTDNDITSDTPVPEPESQITARLRSFEGACQLATSAITDVRRAFKVYEQAASCLAGESGWIDELAVGQTPAATSDAPLDPIASAALHCQRASHAFHKLRALLATPSDDRLSEISQTAETLQTELDALESGRQALWKRVALQKKSSPANAARFLEASLRWLPPTPIGPSPSEQWETLAVVTDESAQTSVETNNLTLSGWPAGRLSQAFWRPLLTGDVNGASSDDRDARGSLEALAGHLEPTQPIVESLNLRATASALAWRYKEEPLRRPNTELRLQQLAARAATTLEDFWHAPQINAQPYYVYQVAELLDSAAQLLPPSSSSKTNPKIAALQQRLVGQQAVIRSPFATAEPLPAITSGASALITLVSPHQQLAVPRGLVTIESSSPDRTLPVASVTLDHQHANTVIARCEDSNLAISFRGLVQPLELDQSKFATNRTSVQRRSETAVSLLVSPAPAPPRALMFVLDCSASMAEPLPLETAAAQASDGSSTGTKLDAAREALLMMMRHPPEPDTRVGLTLYGHRMAINAKGTQTLTQTDYFAAFPFNADLRSYEDVEVVLPPGRFGEVEMSITQQRFAALKPWGESPLHLALLRTIQAMQSTDTTLAKDIIVVTDGVDYQFNPPHASMVGFEQLITAALQQKTRIHIVSFGIPENGPPESLLLLEQLSQETGGTVWRDIGKCRSLVRSLQEQFSPPTEISVEIAGHRTTGRVGQRFSVPCDAQDHASMTLLIQNQRVEVPCWLGASLDLLWDPRGRVLTTRPLAATSRDTQSMMMPDQRPVPAIASLLDPRSLADKIPTPTDGRTRHFPIGFERNDQGLIDRPNTVWMELQPLLERNGQREPCGKSHYLIGDVEWLVGTSAPVAIAKCEGWPSEATHVQAHVWCSDIIPAVDAMVSLHAGEQISQTISLIPGVVSRIEAQWTPPEVNVKITHQGLLASPTDSACLVTIDDQTALNRSHWYAPDGSTSLHSFKLPHVPTGSAAQIRVSLARKFKQGAAVTTEPLISPVVQPLRLTLGTGDLH